MATNLLSVAGLVGSPITVGHRAARITDLVVRHASEDTYPEITGLVVRMGRRMLFAATADVLGLVGGARQILRTPEDLPSFDRRASDVLLAVDVLDRQIIDTDGVHVIRAADLYLAIIGGAMRLIALDTSVRTLVRRLGPRRLRNRPAPQRVIDWSHVDAFSTAPDALQLSAPHASLARMQAGDLASLVLELTGTQS
jgi:hypothetical protein